MTDKAKALVEKLRALHVWPQAVADDHADLLTPRQIDKLYEVGRVSHEAADLIETQTREIERLREACDKADRLADHWFTQYETLRDGLIDILARAAPAGDSHED